SSWCYRSIDFFFFSSRRRHTSWPRDWSSDVCSSDLRTRSIARSVLRHRATERAIDRVLHPLEDLVDDVLVLLEELPARCGDLVRSEERRVGKEGRCWGWR